MNNEFVIYIIVRKDLKMSKGKISAQCGHAVQDLVLNSPKNILKEYINNGNPKVILGASNLEELLSYQDECQDEKIPHVLIVDEGRTQIPENTPTVLGIGPVKKMDVNWIVKHLKLL